MARTVRMASVSYESRWATHPEVECGQDPWSRTPLSIAVSNLRQAEANVPAYLTSNPNAEEGRAQGRCLPPPMEVAAVSTFDARARLAS
jgi:hypothetical protein